MTTSAPRGATPLALAVLLVLASPRPGLASEPSGQLPAGGMGPILVSAAVSLKPALDDIGVAFAARHPGAAVTLNAAASGVLVAQIEHGAPVDLFLSASPEEIDRLALAGRIRLDSRTDLASNRLVVALALDAPPITTLKDLADPRLQRIAIGNPRTVPAGRYAQQALTHLDLWPALQPRLVYAASARQVLDYVARGEVDAGLVYRTDLGLLPGRVVAGPAAPPDAHRPIRYQAVIPIEAPRPAQARALLDFLTSADGQTILASHGFLPPARP